MFINASTKVIFPNGSTHGSSKILMIKLLNNSDLAVFTEETPFHPVDYNWSDQPSDRGHISIDGNKIPVKNCLIAVIHKQTQEFFIDQDVKAKKIKRDDPNWLFLVAHIIDRSICPNYECLIGKAVTLDVDDNYRQAISKSHTASHLVSLALNLAATIFWSKQFKNNDSLGNPDLDREAIQISSMNELESIDVYHLSGSLQKKGFEVQKFLTALPEVERSTNENIVRIQGNTTIKPTINPPVAFLNEKRVWTCGLFGGKVATIPCGGTHAAEINPQNKIIAKFERTGNADFVVRSRIIQ